MLRTYLLALTVVILSLGMVACNAGVTSTPITDLPSAVMAAGQELSQDYDVPVEQIEYVTYTNEDWPDACLGLPNADEMCAQVITPGYRVVLDVDGEQYIYRTDETGQIIRQEF